MTDILDSRLRQWRHHLHQHPETAFAEHATSDYVASALEDLGFEVTRSVGGTGVVGSLTRGTSRRAIGLRADMDALPLQEASGHAYSSCNPGTMHACGHDGHMAMVLGAAARLAADGDFDGTVRAVFQPAEEPGRGAQAMMDDGLLDRFPIDAMYGLHNLPGLPAGHIHTRAGAIMASEDNFEIRVVGRGGHAARPQMVIDPLLIGAEIVLGLQSIVSRNVDPVGSAVLSCTDFQTDGARNAIPGQVRITGDTRSFDPDVKPCWSAGSGNSAKVSPQPTGPAAPPPTPTSSPPPSTTPIAPQRHRPQQLRPWASIASTPTATQSCPARTSASSPVTSLPASPSSATGQLPEKEARPCTAAITTSTTTSWPPASVTTPSSCGIASQRRSPLRGSPSADGYD